MFRTRYLELSMFHPMVLCALPNVERRAMSSAAVFLYLYSIAGKIEAKYVQDDHVRRCIATCSIMRSRVQQSYHLTHRGSMRRGHVKSTICDQIKMNVFWILICLFM